MTSSAFTPTILQDFREASVSQSGIVTTGTQSFAGAKTFEGAFTAGSSTPANIEHLIQGGPATNNVLTLDNNNASPTYTQIRFKMGGVSRGYVGASATNSFQVVNGAGTQFNGQCADGGGWTFGQSGSFTSNAHTFNGGLTINGDGNTLTINKSSSPAAFQFQSGGSNIAQIGGKVGGGLQFYQSSTTEVGSFNNNGAWIFGSSGTSGQHQIQGNGTTNNVLNIYSNSSGDTAFRGIVITKFDNNNSTAQKFMLFQINNGGANNGGITGNGANTAAFEVISDVRTKENIQPLESQLDKLMQLNPCTFDYKEIDGISSAGPGLGFIAQEMENVYPESVSDSGNGYKGIVGWSQTEARLVKAIQELSAKVTSIESKLN
jgi:hypothetical protein